MKTKNKMKTKTKNTKEAITGKMAFGEILEKHPEAAEILFSSGLHCIGCGMAMYETLEDGCKAHGMNKKQIEELIKKLNKRK
jgi:hybrid cluster-associated redox disulfide protein